MLLYNIYIIMRYKIKKRPRRVLKDSKRLPYIKYKNKDISLKGYDIKSIIKIINKLTKEVKTKRLDNKEIKDKKDKINKYLSGQISSVMSGGPQQIVESRLKEDTEKIKELSNEIQLYKSSIINNKSQIIDNDKKLKMIDNKKEDLNDSQNEIKNELKILKDNITDLKTTKKKIKEFIRYDKDEKKYIFDMGILGLIKGDTIQDIKDKIENKYNELITREDKLSKDIDLLKEQYNVIEIESEKIKNEKEEIKKLNNEYLKEVEKLQEEKILLQQEQKKLKKNKKNLEKDITKLNLEKENFKDEIIKEKYRYDTMKRYKDYDLIKKEGKNNLYDEVKMLTGDLINTKEFKNKIYEEYYNSADDFIQKIYEKGDFRKGFGYSVPKELIIEYIIDHNINNKSYLKKPEEQQIQEEQEEQQQGEGINKGGLYNTDIDKIMKPFKDYLGCYANDQIDILIKYIKDNNIKKGGAIINTNNLKDKEGHWVAIWFDTIDDCEFNYYDPFGNNPKAYFIDKFKQMFQDMESECYIKVKINKIKQQSISSNTCGWFSIKFLLERMNNITFKEATKYKKINNNEKDIKELKQQYNKFGFI